MGNVILIVCLLCFVAGVIIGIIRAIPPSENAPPANDIQRAPPANDIQRAPPAELTELNADIIALELRLRDLNKLRDIVLNDYEREPNKERQHLTRLISLDDKIYKTEKELIKLQNKKSLL